MLSKRRMPITKIGSLRIIRLPIIENSVKKENNARTS
jgi:hypothetical protein